MSFVAIRDISDVVSKGTTPTSVGLSFSVSGVPFLKGEDVLGKAINFSKATTYINEESHEILKRSELILGDVLVTIAGTIGRVGFIGDKGCTANCNQAVAFIRPDLNKVDPQWLCYLLQSPTYQVKFSEFVAGGAIPNVNLQQIKSIDIPNVTITKQRRIAAQLKAQLAEVDKARQAVEVQLQEIPLALNQIIETQITRIITKGSKQVNLGEIAYIKSKLVDPKMKVFCDLPHVSASNIESLTGRLMNIQSAKEDGMTSGKYLFDKGDILYSKLRPYLRKVAQPNFRGLCSADMYPLKSDPKVLNMDFLKLLLTSNLFTDYANEKSARARMPKLNRKQLFDFQFIIPSLVDQQSCVKTIDIASSLSVQGIACVKSIKKDLEILPNKILAQAFEI